MQSMGYAYANYFSKTFIVCYRKMPKKSPFHFLAKPPLKLKKNQTIFHPVPTASTAGPCPTIIGLLLRFYNRRNGKCVDPNETDSEGAG